MYKKDFYFFNLAKQIAKDSTFDKTKIGTIIVCKKDVVSVGTNVPKTHPVQMFYNKKYFKDRFVMGKYFHHYIHAELRAILNAEKQNLSGCSIYNYRETFHGKLANSRPCPACMKMIKQVGIKNIYYTTTDGYCKEEVYKNE